MALHLILIGLPGSGKSTAGRLLAARLGTHWTDIDPIIERATGLSVAELFAEEGEASFRAREHRAVVQALGLPPHVVTPGGGWAAQPGNLAALAGRAFPIHLAIDPDEAAARLAGDRTRPLLANGDAKARLHELALVRLPFYQQAAARVDVTGRGADEVADALVALARDSAGWR